MQLTFVRVSTFTLFHSYFRLQALLRLQGSFRQNVAPETDVFPRLIVGDLWVERRAAVHRHVAQDALELTLEALVDRKLFPHRGTLEIACRGDMASVSAETLMHMAARDKATSLNAAFRTLIRHMHAEGHGQRPRMLDVGGRARSGVTRRDEYPNCEVTTFDIVADASVDVLGDAHELSRYFPQDTFDVALCVSVFEHLLMPWKVVLELNAVLKLGGIALVHTHQTVGMHDMPWDFWRFSDTAWAALFNRYTGFEIIEASLDSFMHVVPQAWTPRYATAEGSGGFEGSTVLVRKVGGTGLAWDAPLHAILSSSYPLSPDGNR